MRRTPPFTGRLPTAASPRLQAWPCREKPVPRRPHVRLPQLPLGYVPAPGWGGWSTANRLPEQQRRGAGAAPKEGEVTAHSADPAPSREAAATDMDPRESKRDETCWRREKGCFMLQQRRRSGVFLATSDQVKTIIRFFFVLTDVKPADSWKKPEHDQRCLTARHSWQAVTDAMTLASSSFWKQGS